MSGKRYPKEFKTEAVKQVVDRGHFIARVATQLDITAQRLYAWVKSMVLIHQPLKRSPMPILRSGDSRMGSKDI